MAVVICWRYFQRGLPAVLKLILSHTAMTNPENLRTILKTYPGIMVNFKPIQKHNKSNRINISTIQLDFSEKIDFTVRKGIINFFNPMIQNNRDSKKKKLLTLRFRQDTSQDITGYAFQLNGNSSIQLYKITVSF